MLNCTYWKSLRREKVLIRIIQVSKHFKFTKQKLKISKSFIQVKSHNYSIKASEEANNKITANIFFAHWSHDKKKRWTKIKHTNHLSVIASEYSYTEQFKLKIFFLQNPSGTFKFCAIKWNWQECWLHYAVKRLVCLVIDKLRKPHDDDKYRSAKLDTNDLKLLSVDLLSSSIKRALVKPFFIILFPKESLAECDWTVRWRPRVRIR